MSFALVFALIAGVFGAIQPKINAALAGRAGGALVAGLVNFTVALSVVAVMVVLRPGTRGVLRHVRSWPVSRWTFTAGLGGAVIATTAAFAVETIGVAIFSVAFFAGQISFGLFVDRLGVGPGGVRPIDAPRVHATIVAIAAVACSQIGRPVGEFAIGMVALVVASGAALAFQSAFNGRIAAATGDPFAATALNVAVGTIALGVVAAGLVLFGEVDVPRLPTQPWLYAGGLLGVTLVFCLTVSTRALGVLRATLALLAAQLVTAFVVDWVVSGRVPTAGGVVGAILIAIAVALVGRSVDAETRERAR